jgi:hypothetical protein
METIFNDIRYGIRSLLKHPGFTALAIEQIKERPEPKASTW